MDMRKYFSQGYHCTVGVKRWCRLIDFALVVLKLLMFKVCGSIDISKVECFNLSGTERVKQNPFKIS